MPRPKNEGPCAIKVYQNCSNEGKRRIHESHLQTFNLSPQLIGQLMCNNCFFICRDRPRIEDRDPQSIGRIPPKKKMKTGHDFVEKAMNRGSENNEEHVENGDGDGDGDGDQDQDQDHDHDEDENAVHLNLTRVPNSGSSCVVCDRKCDKDCTKIPYFARQELLLDFGLIVHPKSNCRICTSHLDGNHLKSDVTITRIYGQGQATMDATEAGEFIHSLIEGMQIYRKKSRLDFNGNDLSDEDYKLWTGWKKSEFDEMLLSLKNIRTSKNRTKRDALAMFWIKMKTNLAYSQIASLFLLDDPKGGGRILVARTFETVASELEKNFVPGHLGTKHLDPERAKEHNTAYSKVFFGDDPTSIWDGTYIYTQRSQSYSHGRKSYSMHKHRNLVKFMSVILPDGYVLETVGPFFSNGSNNDAGMTAKILTDDVDGIQDWLLSAEKQVVIVDRGFRNVLGSLEALGNVTTHMPSCEAQGTQQHSEEEANRSRLVTKVRWVVEAYHARFKKFLLLEHKMLNSKMPFLRACLRIVTAALNAFRGPIFNTKERIHDQIAKQMMSIATERKLNPLAERVRKGTLSSRGRLWEEREADLSEAGIIPDFPKLSIDQLTRNITCGTYQIAQAAHYADEHLSQGGGFSFSVHRQAPDIIRVRLQSRHKNATKYFVWIQFSKESIDGWYCQCKSGKRLVGCCAHVATVVWFLGYARYHEYRISPMIDRYWRKVLDSAGGFEDSDEEQDSRDD